MKRRKRIGAGKARRLEVLLTQHVCSGHAVGRTDDGEVVLVEGGLLGERVLVRSERRRGATHGNLLEVVEASEHRRTPMCTYASRCGGCDWMHIEDAEQARLQRAALIELFGRNSIEIPDVVVHHDAALRYRQRARLALVSRAGVVRLGYRKKRDNGLVDIEDCLVLDEALTAALPQLRQLVSGSDGQGEVALALTANHRVTVDLKWKGSLAPDCFQQADDMVATERWAGVRLWQDGVSAPAVFGDARPSFLADDGLPLFVAAGGFAQPSVYGGLMLARIVARLVSKMEVPVAVELFAGSGTLSMALAAKAGKLIAVEKDQDALVQMRENLKLRSLKATIHGVDANTFKITRNCHTLVLDPPRAGAAGAMENAIAARVQQVVYVACDPFTLARDVRTMVENGYRVSDMELVAMFPQTHHFETVVRLARA